MANDDVMSGLCKVQQTISVLVGRQLYVRALGQHTCAAASLASMATTSFSRPISISLFDKSSVGCQMVSNDSSNGTRNL